MIANIIFVALGGGLGSVCRYLCGFIPAPELGGFPIVTMLINFVGALIIGVFAELVDNSMVTYFNISEKMGLFFKVGFCGGFTTFSTFSLEMFNLLDNGKVGMAVSYGVISVIICLLGVILGRYLVKTFCIR